MLVLILNLGKVPGLLKVIGEGISPGVLPVMESLDKKVPTSFPLGLPSPSGRKLMAGSQTLGFFLFFYLFGQAWERQQAATMLIMTLAHCPSTLPSMHNSSPSQMNG